MITTIVSDFSRVILQPVDHNYSGTLNGLNKELVKHYGTYVFFKYFEFNYELLRFYETLKSQYSINIFTSGDIQDKAEVKKRIDPIFDHIYSAEVLNVSKKDSQAYTLVAEKLGKKPDEIIFIDDQEHNVQAAAQAGMTGVVFYDNAKMYKDLSAYIRVKI